MKKWNKLSEQYQKQLFNKCPLRWVLPAKKPCSVASCGTCGVTKAQRGK